MAKRPKVDRDTLRRRINVAIAQADMNDTQVADKANVTVAWLASVKRGVTKNPSMDKLRSLAKVLGVPVRYLTEPLGYIPIDEADSTDWEQAVMSIDLPIEYRRAIVQLIRDRLGK